MFNQQVKWLYHRPNTMCRKSRSLCMRPIWRWQWGNSKKTISVRTDVLQRIHWGRLTAAFDYTVSNRLAYHFPQDFMLILLRKRKKEEKGKICLKKHILVEPTNWAFNLAFIQCCRWDALLSNRYRIFKKTKVFHL